MSDDDVKLNEFDREEWWDFCRLLNPSMTREEFIERWDDFQEEKRRRAMQ